MLVILIAGATAMLLHTLNSTTLRLERDKVTADALAQAKEALISYAVSSDNSGSASARPGNFPCPDKHAPNTVNYGTESSPCSAGDLGRVPWKTLCIAQPVDGSGESLWYALSGNFRKSASIINSDTKGTLIVYDGSGNLLTPPGSEAVAIIFAPGNAIGTQVRNSASDQTSASNYLDIGPTSINNATVNGPFIAASSSDTFNDRLLIIRTKDFMPIVEKRVAKEIKNILTNYYSTHGAYPYPANLSVCKDSLTCTSDTTICRGRLPFVAQPVDWSGSNSLPATGISPWFSTNNWYLVFYYSVGTSRLASAPSGCNPTLNVSGNSAPGLFFMPGSPLGSINRTYPNSNVSWYLEDAENQNLDDNYVTPTSISNDQLYVLP